MRKSLTRLVAVLFVFVAFVSLARADGTPRRRKPPSPPQANSAENLSELVRRAEQAAEAAQAEARRTREQTEAMQQQLLQVTKELAALRQSLAESVPRAVASADSPMTLLADARRADSPTNPQSAIRNPQAADRLTALEEQVEINTAQIKEHAQTKVESDSRFRVKLSGMVLMNAFMNTADSSTRTAPTRAPADWPASPRNNFGGNLRQSTIGLTMEGPRVGGARVSAEAEFDFYGTNGDTFRGNALGNLRLRTASTRLDWERNSMIAGLLPVMISPLNPSSLASVWYPALSNAGNLWQWRPQIILEHRAPLPNSSELVLQGGVQTPFFDTLDGSFIEGGLNYQGRIAFRHKLDVDRKFEFGVAGQAGNRAFTFDRKETTYVISSDWQIPLGRRLELSGEAYFGKANNLGEQSGFRADNYYALSGPLENRRTAIRGVHAVGGWAQLNFKARRDLDFNFALGIEDPRNRDVLDDRRNLNSSFRNRVASGNFIYQLRPNVLFSLEYRRLLTDYAAGRRQNGHYNLAIGYLF